MGYAATNPAILTISQLSALRISPVPLLTQTLVLLGAGGMADTYLGQRVAITELQQTVTAFHVLVGLAAVATSLGSYWIHDDHTVVHKIAAYLGTLIRGITSQVLLLLSSNFLELNELSSCL